MKLPPFIFRLVFDENLDYRYEAKLILFWLLGITLSVVFGFLFSIPFSMVNAPFWQNIALLQGIMIAFLFTTFFSWMSFSKNKEFELNLGLTDKKFLKFFSGLLIGFFLMIVFAFVGYGLGFVDFQLNTFEKGIPDFLFNSFSVGVFYLFAALNEELMFRGYPLQTDLHDGNKWYRILFLSVLFMLMHGLNSNISTIGFINIFLAGIWLSFGAISANTIWYSFGLHFGWNITQSYIFHFPNSGENFFGSVYLFHSTLNDHYSSYITGGLFGPEGSLIVTVLLGIAIYFEKSKQS